MSNQIVLKQWCREVACLPSTFQTVLLESDLLKFHPQPGYELSISIFCHDRSLIIFSKVSLVTSPLFSISLFKLLDLFSLRFIRQRLIHLSNWLWRLCSMFDVESELPCHRHQLLSQFFRAQDRSAVINCKFQDGTPCFSS